MFSIKNTLIFSKIICHSFQNKIKVVSFLLDSFSQSHFTYFCILFFFKLKEVTFCICKIWSNLKSTPHKNFCRSVLFGHFALLQKLTQSTISTSLALKLINCVFKLVLFNEKDILMSLLLKTRNNNKKNVLRMSVLCFYYRINRWANNKIKGKTITNRSCVLCRSYILWSFFFQHGHSYEHPEIKLRYSVQQCLSYKYLKGSILSHLFLTKITHK